MKIEMTEEALSDGSKVFGVKVMDLYGGGVKFACADEKAALEVYGVLDGLVQNHKIVDVEDVVCPSAKTVIFPRRGSHAPGKGDHGPDRGAVSRSGGHEPWNLQEDRMGEMKRWQADVWRFTIAGKSRRGNWYEGRFRWFWLAYVAARTMAFLCGFVTPRKIIVDGDVQDSPYGIRWGIREVTP